MRGDVKKAISSFVVFWAVLTPAVHRSIQNRFWHVCLPSSAQNITGLGPEGSPTLWRHKGQLLTRSTRSMTVLSSLNTNHSADVMWEKNNALEMRNKQTDKFKCMTALPSSTYGIRLATLLTAESLDHVNMYIPPDSCNKSGLPAVIVNRGQ